MGEVIFELEDVHFSYLDKFPALCGLTMKVISGQMIAAIGANGSGKTTFLHILDGLIFPQKGAIKAFGRQIRENAFDDAEFTRFFRKKVGLVFQNPDVHLFCPTVREEILFAPLQLGFGKGEIKKDFDFVVGLLNLENLLERSTHQLSVGEKRKVSIASVLVFSPDVLLLDEPTAGLDPQTTRQLLDLLLDYRSQGKTLITATHDLHIVEEVAECVCVFSQNKKLVKCGSAEEVLLDTAMLKEHNLAHIHSHRHNDAKHKHFHCHLEHHGG